LSRSVATGVGREEGFTNKLACWVAGRMRRWTGRRACWLKDGVFTTRRVVGTGGEEERSKDGWSVKKRKTIGLKPRLGRCHSLQKPDCLRKHFQEARKGTSTYVPIPFQAGLKKGCFLEAGVAEGGQLKRKKPILRGLEDSSRGVAEQFAVGDGVTT